MQTARDIFSYRKFWAKCFGRLISLEMPVKIVVKKGDGVIGVIKV